jgi:hypothetical protein
MKRTLFPLLVVVAAFFLISSKTSDSPFFFTPQMIASHMKAYSDEEKALIEKDLAVVRSICFTEAKNPQNKKPVYLATAGSPGARKSTILERFLNTHPEYAQAVYLDPDQRGLKFMSHTYYNRSLANSVIADTPNYALAVKQAYEKWRGASNYITLTLLEDAFAQKRDIVHGSTSTGDHIPAFLTKVKDAGYEVVLLLCSCEDEFRAKAIEYRNNEQKFYQSTPEEALTKGKFFPQRMPVYFAHADVLHLYWSDDLNSPERVVAILKDGKLQVIDSEALHKFIHKFENDRAELKKEGKEIPSWNDVLKLYTKRF